MPLSGKDREFKFDIKAIGAIIKRLDISIDKIGDIMTSNPFEAYPAIIVEGIKRGCEKSKSISPDEDTVMDWIEEDGIMGENVINIIKSFSDSIVSLLPKQDGVKVPNGKAKK
ncbi:MAG: hypothetical protein QXT80_03975 [Thermoplasmatales archaeon]